MVLSAEGDAKNLSRPGRGDKRTFYKHFILKVMFLCVVARPYYDHRYKCYLDGKICLRPLVEMIPAKRSSRNRPAGILEEKSLTFNRDLYRSYLTEYVFPAIRENFPVIHRPNIVIQQDNARPHVSVHDSDVKEKGGLETGIFLYPVNQLIIQTLMYCI